MSAACTLVSQQASRDRSVGLGAVLSCLDFKLVELLGIDLICSCTASLADS